MSREYDAHEQWGYIDQAADAFGCDESELAAWAARGDIIAHHKRGADGGWLFPLNRVPDIERLRQVEKDIEESRSALQLSLPLPLDPAHEYYGTSK